VCGFMDRKWQDYDAETGLLFNLYAVLEALYS